MLFMPYLPMYVLEKDVFLINEILNQDPQIAFLICNGPKTWMARQSHNITPDIGSQPSSNGNNSKLPNFVEYALWHIPSGPLPLISDIDDFKQTEAVRKDWVQDPWKGWTEKYLGPIHRRPYFGAGHPGIINLEIRLPLTGEIRISSFSWIGDHYKMIGIGANPATIKFWYKLRRTIKKVAKEIPRGNNPNWKKEIFAFPEAYSAIKSGNPCALNP